MKKTLAVVIPVLFLAACNNNDKKPAATTDTLKPVRTNTVAEEKKKPETPAEKPAIINIIDTVAPKRIVLFMKDSAKSFDRIGMKLGIIYGVKLGEVLKKNGLKMAGPPMAWYKSQKPPYFFEAGVAVNKKPAKVPANVFVREMSADSVTLAHFYGPFTLLGQGYDALKERLKDEKKSPSGAPYELYVDDPIDKNGKPVDPYKVRTDIVFPRH